LALYESQTPYEVAAKIAWLLKNNKFRSVILTRMSGLDMAYIALCYIQFRRRYEANPAGRDKRAMADCLTVLACYLELHASNRNGAA
jgi:hypothetical protein